MVAFPNAKINIGLHVTGKRPDGYHNIESCFYPARWSDMLEIVESAAFTFNATGVKIPGEAEQNLCVKAYRLLAEQFAIPPVAIYLHKLIPIGAGLGGGSSDGAFALKLLNELFDLSLGDNELQKYALQLGSDCPFFIRNEPVFVGGRGEQFSRVNISLAGKFMYLVSPDIHISTGEAYSGLESYSEAGALKTALETEPLENWKDKLRNDFEPSVFKKYPELAKIKAILYEEGAVYASMTGSGATVFGLFNDQPDLSARLSSSYAVKGAFIG